VPLDVAARACCCPARPVVTVVMPPTASRPHSVDLLLCGHHFRASQAALRAAGVAVYDEIGLLGAAKDMTATLSNAPVSGTSGSRGAYLPGGAAGSTMVTFASRPNPKTRQADPGGLIASGG
jgi:hypothetical protein